MKFNTVRHLALFLASLLAVSLLASWVLIAKNREHTSEALEVATQKQLQLLHDGLYTKLNQLERVLVEGSHMTLEAPSPTYIQHYLQMLKAMHPDFVALDYTPLPPSIEPQQAKRQSKLQIQVNIQNKGQALLVLKHPVETPDGHTIGLLVGNISVETIKKTLEQLSMNDQTISAIALSDGRLIAIQPEPVSLTPNLQALNAWSHPLDLDTYPKRPLKLSTGQMEGHYTVGTPLLPSSSEGTPWPLLLVTWVKASTVENNFLQNNGVWLVSFVLLSIFTVRQAHQLRKQLKAQQDFQDAAFTKQQHQQDTTQALQQAEERFRSAFESSAIGMAILNPEGVFTQVNSALCQWIGYQAGDLLRMDHISISHPEDAMLHWPSASHIGNDIQDDYQVEQRYIHQEGRILWGLLAVSAVRDTNQQILHIILQVQDITARKQQEASLIEREHFLRTLSECLPSLVSYWSADLYCHFANKNHEKWTGIPSDKMRGLHLRHVMGESDFLEFEPYIHGVLLGKQQRFERSVAHKSGQQDDLLVHLIPDVLYGHVEGFFSIATSITDFKTQQRELERMNKILVERTDQAEAANKAKGAFLANMSHEIRTPMNAIMGLLQLIEQTDLSHTQKDYISKIGGAADVLLNVLNDILDLSRIEANKLELRLSRFSLNELLQQTLDLFSYRAEEKGIQISCSKHPDSPNSLMGDRLRIAQVLNNLLSNALKFTEKGTIEVQVAPSPNQRTLVFCVKDPGIGISKTQVDLLFQPFSQIDNSPSRRYGGAGLGLSICKQITELMHGKIWVESEPEQGTSFYVEIPNQEPDYTQTEILVRPHNHTHKASTTAQQPLPLKDTKILVVDDHKLNQMVASEMLKNWGAKVQTASNGREAVLACTQEHFDWVLMDLQMPEMDGFEATRLIHKQLGEQSPKIIALTASASPQDVTQLLNAGMRGHIVKPFKKEQLLEIMGASYESHQSTSMQLLPVK